MSYIVRCQVENVISPMAIRCMLPQSREIHNIIHVKILEPYQVSVHTPGLGSAQVLRNMDYMVTEEFEIQENHRMFI
jgi:hypothetical protein